MAIPGAGERRAFARALVAEFAPEELPDFDDMTAVYFASPRAARRAHKPRDEAGGLLIDPGDPTFTNIVWGVVAGLTTEALLLGLREGRSRFRRLFRRPPAPNPDTPMPDLPPELEDAARHRIRQGVERARPDVADAVADRSVDRWKRRDWTPPE